MTYPPLFRGQIIIAPIIVTELARQGAGVVYLNIFHKDVIAFLSTKKENADEKIRVKTLSLGLVVPDKFYELVAKGKHMYLFSPYDIEKEYGVVMSEFDITENYDDLVSNPRIRKDKINARELENEISKLIQESGYPFIINIDTANKENPVDGKIKMSNLCVTGDTELLTDKGYIRADELYKTQEELNVVIDNRTKHLNSDEKGISLVSAIPMQLTAKQADVYEIKTKQGFTIKSTEWHKYYVQKEEGEIVKIPMTDLEVGDKLLVQSDEGSFGNNHDVEVAYLMGLITGDGTLSKNKNGISTARIVLHGDKSKIKNVVEEYTENVIKNYELQEVKHNASLSPKFNVKEQDGREFISMDSGLLGRILDEHFNFTKENKLEIPQYIKNGTKEVQSAYLSGLYQMDGTVNVNKKALAMTVELSTISEILAKDIQKILLNLGIYSTIYEREAHVAMLPDSNREYVETKCRKLYKISIQDRKAREKFLSSVTLKDEDIEKAEDFNSILSEKSRNPKHKYTAEISSIEFYGVEDVYDTTQEDYHSLIFNGVVTGNCTEILQVQKPSVINNDQSHAELGVDVSCNLGSTNVANLMKSEDFGGSVKTMFRALTQVADSSNIDVVPTVKNANDKYHSVGLGAMNLAGYLAKNKIMYDSDLAIEFTGIYFMLLNYWTLVASNEIARERKQKFYEFEKSEYANGKYFERYMPRVKVYEDLSNEAKQLFKDVEIPTKDDWKQLQKDIEKDGLYTSYRLAVAPTGSIAYINESTASIHPIVQKIEKRSEGKRGDIFYPAPYIDEGALPYYVSAYKIDQRRLIDLYAEAQKHVDQALSMTLFMDSEDGHELYEWKKDSSKRDKTTTRDINILRNYAWAKDIKSIYYVRTFTADKESSSVNECESCSI